MKMSRIESVGEEILEIEGLPGCQRHGNGENTHLTVSSEKFRCRFLLVTQATIVETNKRRYNQHTDKY